MWWWIFLVSGCVTLASVWLNHTYDYLKDANLHYVPYKVGGKCILWIYLICLHSFKVAFRDALLQISVIFLWPLRSISFSAHWVFSLFLNPVDGCGVTGCLWNTFSMFRALLYALYMFRCRHVIGWQAMCVNKHLDILTNKAVGACISNNVVSKCLCHSWKVQICQGKKKQNRDLHKTFTALHYWCMFLLAQERTVFVAISLPLHRTVGSRIKGAWKW